MIKLPQTIPEKHKKNKLENPSKARGPMPEETREKIRQKLKGRKSSAERLANWNASFLAGEHNRAASNELKLKLSAISLNSKIPTMSDEQKDKIRQSKKGASQSEKNILRRGLSRKGIEHIHIESELFSTLKSAAGRYGHRYPNSICKRLGSSDPLWKDWYYIDDAEKNPTLQSNLK